MSPLSRIVKIDSEVGKEEGKREEGGHGVELDLIRGKKIDIQNLALGGFSLRCSELRENVYFYDIPGV